MIKDDYGYRIGQDDDSEIAELRRRVEQLEKNVATLASAVQALAPKAFAAVKRILTGGGQP